MRLPAGKLSTSFSSNRISERFPSPLSPSPYAGAAPFSAPLPSTGSSDDSIAASTTTWIRVDDGREKPAAFGSSEVNVVDLRHDAPRYPPSSASAVPPRLAAGDANPRVTRSSSAAPPFLRANSLPTIYPIPVPSSPPIPSYSTKSPTGLRVNSSPASPPSQHRLEPSSRLRALLTAVVPHALLPASLAEPRPFQYPKSPSLLRPHPQTRHGRRSVWLARRFLVVLIVLVLLASWWTLIPSDAGWEGGPWSSWRTGELVRAEQRAWGRIASANTDYAMMLERLRGGAKEEPAPPLVVEATTTVAVSEEVAETVEREEEQAVLNAVVEQAVKEQEQAVKEQKQKAVVEQLQAKETMAKVVREKKKPSVEAAPDPKKKDPSRYKRLLPLGVPSRRYLYGANFIQSAEDGHTEVDDPEFTNHKVKVPSKKQLQRIFEENKARYEEEGEGWRTFEWEAPPAHPSLEKLVDKLSKEELELREWIRHLHTQPPASGVGLGASTLPSTDVVLAGVAPTLAHGSLDKYADLLVQAEAGHAGKCQSSTWLTDYEKMHAEMLSGARDPKFISYHCERGMNCGGLGDRLLGMTSAFFFGLVTQRAFLGEWQSPIPLEVVFDSPHVNWSYSSFTSQTHPVLGQQPLVDASAELDIIHFDRLSVDATFGTSSWNPKRGRIPTPGFEKRDLAYQSPWIKFFTNRGMIYRSFAYKHLQKSIGRLGLQPTTAFACISQYLFRPKPPALNLIADYTSVLALPSVFSVGIHVRTGDQSMKDPEYDKVNTVKRHSQFFRCARELGETYATKDQRIIYYLVTDSANLKQDAQQVLGDKLVTTDMLPQHVHQKSGHADGVFSAVVEDWILAKTDMLVATQDSGFGKLAAFMHAKENSTVTIFPRYNPDVMGLQSKKSHMKVDCTSPDVFTTFEELSSEWSLG
ncbi:hypothetical protein JCM21900_000022 [Sporobolomyces salmonicolor]